ncbi:MAG: tetratricopeptide repeat protein [Candidatus Eiseniibacteriota bacterium]
MTPKKRPRPPGSKAKPDAGVGQPARRPLFDRLPWLGPAALLLMTAAVYARSLLVPILDWDDYVYYFRDARLESFTLENLGRIMTQSFFANFHPVTTLSFALDRALWGAWAPGFHITHLAFYLGGVIALYFLFTRLLGSRAGGFAAAAIYAVHTIHVESVAWLAARKDVVCLLFYSLSLLTYVRYAAAPRGRSQEGARPAWGAYPLSLVFAGAAMLSKGYAVILPAVMLAYDVCYTGRITRRQILDKIPFLILTGATILLTVHAQDKDTALIQSTMTLGRRASLLAKIFSLYIGKSVLPVGLSAFYIVAGKAVEGYFLLFGALAALGSIAGFLYWRRRLPAAAFGIALFLLPLGTVMNFIYTLRIWMADRYLFFPTIGLSLLAVAVVGSWGAPAKGRSRGAASRTALAVLTVSVLALYSFLTIQRIGVWTSPISLWSDTLRQDLALGGSGPVTASDLRGATDLRMAPTVAIQALQHAYESAGRQDEAARIGELMGGRALGGPEERDMATARDDLDAGRYDDAIAKLKPISEGGSWLAPQATIWIGVAQNRKGDLEASRQTLNHAIELYRKSGQPATDAYFGIGAMEFNKGNYAKALEWYRLANQESPKEAKAAFYLARCLEETGKTADAMTIYKRIASGELPVLAGAQFGIPDVYSQMESIAEREGRTQEAIGYLEDILRVAPNHPQRAAVEARLKELRSKGR